MVRQRKKTSERVLSVVLTVMMVVTLIPAALLSETENVSAYSSTDVKWTDGVTGGAIYFDSDTGEITDCDTSVTSVEIPEEINGVSVMSIGEDAFYRCKSLTSITIPTSVTSIGGSAFEDCSSLISITIPDSVTSICRDVFSGCKSLTSITIPDSVTSIGDRAFYYCESLTSITIPNSVTSIGGSAFEDCESLTSITIPETVTYIGGNAFNNTPWLTSKREDNVLVVVNNILIDGRSAVGIVSVPNSVTSIGACAFEDCSSLTSITIPNSVTSIGGSAFEDCGSLTSITIPDSVTSIGVCAFYNCESLTSITIPDSVTFLGSGAFYGCELLEEIRLSDNIENRIETDTFEGCDNLKSIIMDNKFDSNIDCDIDREIVYFVDNDMLYAYSKKWNEISDVVFPPGIQKESFEYPQFNNYKLKTTLSGFYGNKNIKTITLSNGWIGTFGTLGSDHYRLINDYIVNLESIYLETNLDDFESIDGVLYRGTTNDDNSLPRELLVYPRNKQGNFYKIENGTERIIEEAFGYNNNLENIKLPDYIKDIESRAFVGCKKLNSIVIPSSIEELKGETFAGCDELERVIIPSSVKEISSSDFSGDEKLTIYGYKGSYAETYAKKEGIPFSAIDEYKSVDDVDVATDIDTDTESIKLFEDAGGSVGDKPIAKIFPGDYNLEFPYIKTKVVKETKEDGTYKLKMSIGVNDNIVFGSKKGWEKLKKDIDDAREHMSDTVSMAALVRKWGNGSANFNITKKFKKKPDMDVIGYYELTFDENGKIISDTGGAVIKADWKASVTQQCVLAPVPVPFYVELGGKLSAKAKGEIEQAFSDLSPKFNGKLNISPEIYAGAGLGISSVATVGVRGKGGVDIQVAPPSKGDFTAGLSITAQVLFVFDEEVTIAEATYPLWDTTKKSISLNALKSSVEQLQESSLELTNRSYQDKTTGWLDSGSKIMNRLGVSADNEDTDQGITFKALQEYVMPNTMPQMKKVGSDTVMVFQSNDSSRDTINSSKLMYSVYNGSSWSEPKALWDNGTLDAFADLEVVGDELYVTWQKCNKVITQTDDIDAMGKELVSSSEICVSKYNSSEKAFETPVKITDNPVNDYIPVFAYGSDEPAVIWVSSDSDDITCMKGNKEIKLSKLTSDGWSEPEVLGTTGEYIVEIAGAYADDEYKTTFISADSDNNQKLCSAAGAVKTLVEPSDNTIASVKCSGGNIIYNQDGVLKETDFTGSAVSEITAGETYAISSNAQEVSVSGKNAVIWMTNEEDGCTFYSSLKLDSGYSEPVELYKNADITGNYFTAALDGDGNWEIVLNGTETDNTEKTSMYFLNKSTLPKLELDSIVVNETEIENNVQPVSYTVKNDSEETITSYTLKITADDNAVLEKEVTCSIAPGETQYVEDEFDINGISDTASIKVQAVAAGQSDKTDTVVSKEMNLSDIGIEVAKVLNSDFVEFTVKVTNEGQSAQAGNVTLYGDVDGTQKLTSVSFDEIAPGETTEVPLEFKANDMVFNGEQTAYCMIKAETDVQEADDNNNIYYGAVYMRELPEENFNVGFFDVTLSEDTYTYDGSEKTPDVEVINGDKKLEKHTDYTLEYKDNINAGTASAIIRGIGNYHGELQIKYEIRPKKITDSNVSSPSDSIYSGKQVTPDITVKCNGVTLKKGTDYDVSYGVNKYPGSGSVTVEGKGNYTGVITKTFSITPPDLDAPAKVTVNLNGYNDLKANWSKVDGATGYYVYYKNYAWNSYRKLGSTTKLSFSKADLTDGERYSFRVYPYVKINGQVYLDKSYRTSGYVYTLKKLNKPAVNKSSGSYVKVSWNNIPGVSGYEIARSKYSTKKFTVVKRVSYKYKSTTIKTPRNVKYYYKVRAYKTVDGKRIYGPWSSVKSYTL